MKIRSAKSEDTSDWAQMRAQLWPELSVHGHLEEIEAMRSRPSTHFAAYIALDERDAPHGFAEVALRHDYVNGCETSPVAYLEGIWVHPDARMSGVGQALLEAACHWASDQGCTELASDADLDNVVSQNFHKAAGFTETERVVFYKMKL